MLAKIASLSPGRLIFRKRDFSSEIFISRLSYYTTDKELSDAFSAFGTVKSARIIRDPRTNRPKGFGFVNYATEVEAQKAVKAMDGRTTVGKSAAPLNKHNKLEVQGNKNNPIVHTTES